MSNSKNNKFDLEERTAKFGENVIRLRLNTAGLAPRMKGEDESGRMTG